MNIYSPQLGRGGGEHRAAGGLPEGRPDVRQRVRAHLQGGGQAADAGAAVHDEAARPDVREPVLEIQRHLRHAVGLRHQVHIHIYSTYT